MNLNSESEQTARGSTPDAAFTASLGTSNDLEPDLHRCAVCSELVARWKP